MKKILLFFLVLFCASKLYCQDVPIPDGYKLRNVTNFIYVYRDSGDEPDFSVRNRWDTRYWFKIDHTITYEDPKTKEIYIRLTIPSEKRYDKVKGWTTETDYKTSVDWKDEEYIDGSDFNSWLWIKEKDLEKKENHYKNIKGQFVFSGLTIPFKFRPKVGDQTSSVINGDINLGTFLGYRLTKSQNFGMSIGGHFGISSIALNASNNSAISGNSSETIQGFIYGYGVVFDIKKQFQLGIVGGFDNAIGGLAKTYVYQNKNWFAFSLNFKFLDFGYTTDNSNKSQAPN